MVGRDCIPRLLAAGYRVRAMQHRQPVRAPGAELVEASLGDPQALRRALQGVAVVVHAAARMDATAEVLREVNIHGTSRLCAAARAVDVRRIVLLSSASVYTKVPMDEADESFSREPATAYGMSKLAAEAEVGQWFAGAASILRPCSIYTSGPCPILAQARVVAARPELPLFRGGTNPVELLHTGDLSRAIEAAIAAPQVGCFNLRGPDRAPFRELLDFVAARIGTRPSWREVDDVDLVPRELREPVTMRRTMSIDAARRALAFTPRVGWREGLARGL